ncbi:GNAT family N-acetyltransferase [Microbacteriaceae bacterium 4G12]
MIREIDIQNEEIARAVLGIQIPSYEVEAKLIGFFELPPLKDTVMSLQRSGETFYGYFVGEELAGVISYKRDGNILDIHRLVVHPQHFRKGIASSLLHFIDTNYSNVTKTVSTAEKNTPAIALYNRYGFWEKEKTPVTNQLTLVHLEKMGG